MEGLLSTGPTTSSIHFNHKLFQCRLGGVDCFQLKVSALSSLPAKLAGTEVAFEWFLACKKGELALGEKVRGIVAK